MLGNSQSNLCKQRRNVGKKTEKFRETERNVGKQKKKCRETDRGM